ncbi:uncharacterized protein [Typha latifolia]|uniref:uncharacterized protein n=1 Tax=Typha latifolia TaxID=4733 RepID=UPI003C2B5064
MKYTTEITHFSHPDHKLRPESSHHPFKCDGCKEAGIGSRFSCHTCDYDLHHHCAAATASATLRHPFYPKCLFVFLPRPPGDLSRYCNACGRDVDVDGFVYHCRTSGYDLHPCCAALPHELDVAGGPKLFLSNKTGAECQRCERKGRSRSWSYRSACKSYNLHVACVKDMLVDGWQEIYDGQRGLAEVPAAGGDFQVVLAAAGGSYGGSYVTKPSTTGLGMNPYRKKGKVKRCCELLVMAVRVIISALLGDPTAIIAAVITSFISG